MSWRGEEHGATAGYEGSPSTGRKRPGGGTVPGGRCPRGGGTSPPSRGVLGALPSRDLELPLRRAGDPAGTGGSPGDPSGDDAPMRARRGDAGGDASCPGALGPLGGRVPSPSESASLGPSRVGRRPSPHAGRAGPSCGGRDPLGRMPSWFGSFVLPGETASAPLARRSASPGGRLRGGGRRALRLCGSVPPDPGVSPPLGAHSGAVSGAGSSPNGGRGLRNDGARRKVVAPWQGIRSTPPGRRSSPKEETPKTSWGCSGSPGGGRDAPSGRGG